MHIVGDSCELVKKCQWGLKEKFSYRAISLLYCMSSNITLTFKNQEKLQKNCMYLHMNHFCLYTFQGIGILVENTSRGLHGIWRILVQQKVKEGFTCYPICISSDYNFIIFMIMQSSICVAHFLMC